MKPGNYQSPASRQHIRRRQYQVLLATVTLAVVLAAGFYIGQRAAYSGMGISPDTYRQMKAEVPDAREQIEKLEHERDVSSARNDIDRAALEIVRKEISAQKEQIMNLQENLRFYQSLMAPEEIARGLVLRPVEIIASDSVTRFGFRIVAQQEARKHGVLKGSLSATVYGKTDGVPLSYPLSALSENVENDSLTLRFRYFQAIEGELELPANFEPEGILLVAKASSPKKIEVREDYPWAVQERFAYVRK